MVFRSKIAMPLLIILGIVMTGVCITELVSHAWGGLAVNLLGIVLFIHFYTGTYYTITTTQLLVRCGFLVNISMDIAQIKTIAETNSVLSAPALSMDRLEVFYNKYDSVIISPGDKAGFIQALTTINPQIAVKYKVKKA
jgi:hypothetical protein